MCTSMEHLQTTIKGYPKEFTDQVVLKKATVVQVGVVYDPQTP